MKKKGAFIFVFLFLLVNYHTAFGIERKDFIRLHVIANSDCNEDQEIKLLIKDTILEILRGIKEKENINEGEMYIKNYLKDIENYLDFVLQKYGFEYQAQVSLKWSVFPTRSYHNLNLPAGEYNALKVVLGQGKGTNWWCVIYPPLCISNNLEKKENAANNSISVLLDKGRINTTKDKRKEGILGEFKSHFINTLIYIIKQ